MVERGLAFHQAAGNGLATDDSALLPVGTTQLGWVDLAAAQSKLQEGMMRQTTLPELMKKVVLRDLVVMVVDGGDCLTDLLAMSDQPAVFEQVPSTLTAYRFIDSISP